MAVSRVIAGVLEDSSGKTPGKLLEIFSRIAKGKPAGNIGSTLPGTLPTLRAGCFSKSTVTAFSSFSDFRLETALPVQLVCCQDSRKMCKSIFWTSESALPKLMRRQLLRNFWVNIGAHKRHKRFFTIFLSPAHKFYTIFSDAGKKLKGNLPKGSLDKRCSPPPT